MPSISIVIPAYDEESALPDMLERSVNVLQKCTDDWEMIILDDGSSDGTAAIIREWEMKYPGSVRGLFHETNQGIASTLEDLYAAATKEYIFDIAGDGQYPPEALLEIMPLLERYDVVVCNRVIKHYTPYRKFISRCYRWMPRLLFGVDLFDSGSTKVRKREIHLLIPVESKGVFVEAERLIKAAKRGYKIGKVDIIQETRKGGRARGAKFSSVSGAITDMARLWFALQILRRKP